MTKYDASDYIELDKVALDLRMDYGFYGSHIDIFQLAEFLGMELIPYSSLSTEKNQFIL